MGMGMEMEYVYLMLLENFMGKISKISFPFSS
jgi:hypothetical protein